MRQRMDQGFEGSGELQRKYLNQNLIKGVMFKKLLELDEIKK